MLHVDPKLNGFDTRPGFCPLGRAWRSYRAELSATHIDLAFERRATDDPACDLDVEVHFVVRQGESGFHTYSVLGRRESGSSSLLAEFRFNLRLSPTLFAPAFAVLPASTTEPRAIQLPRVEDFSVSERILDSVYRYQRNGTEYVYSKYESLNPAAFDSIHGIVGGQLGVYILSASHEFANGGPSHAELTAELTAKSGPIVHKYFHGSHGDLNPIAVPAGWQKVYGPVFALVRGQQQQTATTHQDHHTDQQIAAGWSAANAALIKLQHEWPPPFVKHPLWTGRAERHAVRGTIELPDRTQLPGTSPGWAVLAEVGVPLSETGRGYTYWSALDADGHFTIHHVPTGNYSLWVDAPFAWPSQQRLRTVPVRRSMSLKTFRVFQREIERPYAVANANKFTAWSIGAADLSVREFARGEMAETHTWGSWLPADSKLTFTVGSSDERRDWPVALPLFAVGELWQKASARRRIIFRRQDASSPQVWRSVRIIVGVLSASKLPFGAEYPLPNMARGQIQKQAAATLMLRLNGKHLGELGEDGFCTGVAYRALTRSVACPPRLLSFSVPWSSLQPDNNTLVLLLHGWVLSNQTAAAARARVPIAVVMFDFVRLDYVDRAR